MPTGSRSAGAALIAALERAKGRFGAGEAAARRAALVALPGQVIRDPAALLRLHEVLCFLRAYPSGPEERALVDGALEGFGARVAAVAATTPARAAQLDESGVAGTAVYAPLSYPAARWLAGRAPGAAEVDWEDADSPGRAAALLPFALDLAAEDALVEVGVPVRAWLRAAGGRDGRSDLAWLLDRLASGPLGADARDALWDALGLRVRWDLGESADSRTRAHVPAPVLYQRGPLARWRAPLARGLPGAPVSVRRAERAEGARLLDAAQAAVLVRYREVHAFNRADPADVLVVEAGRGAQLAWLGLQPAYRLPLRAHYGYLLLKNGVPVGYGDVSLFLEQAEVAFNVFETFRQGESAFLLVRLCAFLFQRLGARVFRLSPYQLGQENEEALASGAFWFYYRLGFRPGRPDLARLAAAERQRIRRHPGHRSSRATLARLAEGGMALAVRRHDAAAAGVDARRLGLEAAGRAARAGHGPDRALARALGAGRWRTWPPAERRAFARWAAVLAGVPGLGAWPVRDRRALRDLIRAKGRGPEADYLRRLREHRRLRRSLVALAAAPDRPGGGPSEGSRKPG